MGCNCGRSSNLVARTTTGAAGDSTIRTGQRLRTKVRFFVAPPPEESADELVYDTLYEARAAMRSRPGWRLESRRVEVTGA
jgi:hypothetical protein